MPEAKPTVWNVPFPRNGLFTGREEVLARLRDAHGAGQCVILTAADPAASGLGRTQLAVEYAHRFSGDYERVWWVRAKHPAVLAAEYAQLGAAIGVKEAAGGQRGLIDSVRAWLGAHDGWLLIFDGLAQASSLDRYVPAGHAGHVLVIAGATQIPAGLTALAIDPFTPDEAAAFLLKRVPPKSPEARAEAEALAACLSHIPLALHLIAAYAAATDMTLVQCRESLGKLVAEPTGGIQATVAKRATRAALSLCLKRLAEENPLALDLLIACAFLASEDIPLGLFRDGSPFLPPRLSSAAGDDAALRGAAATLHGFGLAQLAGDALAVHSIVQTVVREGMRKEQRTPWASAMLSIVAHAFPFEAQYDHPIPACGRLLGHGFATTRHAERLGTGGEAVGFLLNQMGLYLRGCYEFAEARRCYRRAVSSGKQVYGEKHPTLAIRINNLGVAHEALGELPKAASCYREALAMCEALYGAGHEALVTPTQNLCNVLEAMGELDAARAAYGRALTLYETVFGWNHSTTAECLNGLGKILHAQNRFPKARKCFESAIMSEENTENPNRTDLAVYLNNLGSVLLRLGEKAEAQKQFERALDLDKAEFGEGHGAVARDLANLGQALKAQKRHVEARKYYEQALELFEKTEPQPSDRVAHVLISLGKVLQALGEFAAAKAQLERALAIAEDLYGAQAPEVARHLMGLGEVCEELTAYAEAQTYFEKALAIEESVHGPKHTSVAAIVDQIGCVLRAQGRSRDALVYFKRALAIDTSTQGENHPSAARDAFHIGCALHETGDALGAVGHLTWAAEIYEKALGRSHAKTVEVQNKLSELSG